MVRCVVSQALRGCPGRSGAAGPDHDDSQPSSVSEQTAKREGVAMKLVGYRTAIGAIGRLDGASKLMPLGSMEEFWAASG